VDISPAVEELGVLAGRLFMLRFGKSKFMD
jgi:hypothetical protein